MNSPSPHKASWWSFEGGNVRCGLCPHECVISPGATGRCRVRKHERTSGLVALNYGLVSSAAVDPIEKKPLYHWRPGSSILSFGSVGCSMDCPFCQNWQIAEWMPSADTAEITADTPLTLCKNAGCTSAAFTYNEPFTWYEFVLDASRVLRENSIAVVLVTNGMISPGPLADIAPLVSAANIDLKAFTPEAYRKLGGNLEAVKNTISTMIHSGIHVEITFLLVPGINDEKGTFEQMTGWMAGLVPQPVLHISRYFPNRRWERPPTGLRLMEEFAEIALEKLPYVYKGNTGEESRTVCRGCGKILIRRKEYVILENTIDREGRCTSCGMKSPVIS